MASGINETIDLCDSEDEAQRQLVPVGPSTNKKKKSKKKKKGVNSVEIITLDESSIDDANNGRHCSVLNEATLRLSLQEAKNVVPTVINKSEPDVEEDIQIIGECNNIRVTAPANGGGRKFRFFHNQPFVIDRRPSPALKARSNPFFISGSNSARGSRGKRGKKGGRGNMNNIPNMNKTDRVAGLFSPNLLNSTMSHASRWRAARVRAAKMVQIQAMSGTPRNSTKKKKKPKENRKDKVILQDGKPKFRLKPHNEVAQPLAESVGVSAIPQPIVEQETVPGPSSIPFAFVTNVDPGVTITAPLENALPQNEVVNIGEETVQPAQVSSNWSIYGSNAYKSGHSEERTKGSLRPVVIDGSNVAMSHGNNSVFSCKGIEICSNYFKARGHAVVAFVPRYRMKARQSQDSMILEKLEKAGIVKFTPSREVGGERITSYDDRFIVQFAADVGGIIVSNDNFRDLFAEQPLWRDTIRNRILQYTWVTESYIMFPPDPLGVRGPNLDEFLRF